MIHNNKFSKMNIQIMMSVENYNTIGVLSGMNIISARKTIIEIYFEGKIEN